MYKPSLSASLPHIAGSSLPPLDLGIPAEYQFCVDAGTSAAAAFFGNLSDFNLHDHIAFALQSFSTSVAARLAAAGQLDPVAMQEYSDAFAAGYLGRIQQELRLFHGEATSRHHAAGSAATPANINAMN